MPRNYCLQCYHALEAFETSRQVCPRCKHANLKIDCELYWTREPRIVHFELALKGVIVILIGWITYNLFAGLQPGSGMGHGMGAGLPIVLGAILWQTASKVTRREPYFRATIVWSVILAVIGLPLTVVGVLLLSAGEQVNPPMAGPWIFGIGATFLALALSMRPLTKAYSRWQTEHILSRCGSTR